MRAECDELAAVELRLRHLRRSSCRDKKKQNSRPSSEFESRFYGKGNLFLKIPNFPRTVWDKPMVTSVPKTSLIHSEHRLVTDVGQTPGHSTCAALCLCVSEEEPKTGKSGRNCKKNLEVIYLFPTRLLEEEERGEGEGGETFAHCVWAVKTNQFKSYQIYFCDTKIQIPMKESKIKSNVPTGHKGSKELHQHVPYIQENEN